MRRTVFFFLIMLSLLFGLKDVYACDACGCTLSKISNNVQKGEQAKPWFFDFTVEQQRWKTQSAQNANDQVNDGHDVHDKIHEEFYHFMIGVSPTDRFSVLAEMPYVVREALEVEDLDNLGSLQHSEGWGDLSLLGVYKVLVKDDDFLGVTGGVKFPSGETKNRDFQGELFEVEMQPGSGSFDYPVGIVYRHTISPIVISIFLAPKRNPSHKALKKPFSKITMAGSKNEIKA